MAKATTYVYIILLFFFSCSERDRNTFYDNGQIKTLCDSNECISYDSLGNIKARYRIDNDVKSGKEIIFKTEKDPNTYITNWDQGVKEGKAFKIDSSRGIVKEFNFVKGEKFGEYIVKSFNNVLLEKGNYLKDKPNGFIKKFNNGKIYASIQVFEDSTSRLFVNQNYEYNSHGAIDKTASYYCQLNMKDSTTYVIDIEPYFENFLGFKLVCGYFTNYIDDFKGKDTISFNELHKTIPATFFRDCPFLLLVETEYNVKDEHDSIHEMIINTDSIKNKL